MSRIDSKLDTKKAILSSLVGRAVTSFSLIPRNSQRTEKFIFNIENEVDIEIYFEKNSQGDPMFKLNLALNVQNELEFFEHDRICGFDSAWTDVLINFLDCRIINFDYSTLLGKSKVEFSGVESKDFFEIHMTYGGPPGSRGLVFVCEPLEGNPTEIFMTWITDS